MATTRIWKVKNNIPRVIGYAADESKTVNPKWSKTDYQTMRDVMDYVMDDAKTERQFYVTALNCNADKARYQMQMTKKRFGKTDGILAWHGYQSFAEGEVDADTAHEIGAALVRELWPEFEVIVATHLNTHCFHNHFVLNSVSFIDGKKFNACRDSYRKMRSVSDRLCREHGLSVITEHRAYYPKHYAEWQAEQKGKRTWRSSIREDVDRAVMVAMTWSAFLRALREQGYEVKTGVKHIAIRPWEKERFVCLRSLGANYTEEAIKRRILGKRMVSLPAKHHDIGKRRVKVRGSFTLSKVTWKGLRALYFFYLRRLRQAQKRPDVSVSRLLREDLRLLDKVNEQTKFLLRHHIDTGSELAAFRRAALARADALIAERTELCNEKRRTCVDLERVQAISKRLAAIRSELKTLRRDIKLCGEIAERSVRIAKKQRMLREEMIKDVSDRRSGRAGREGHHKRSGKGR